MLLNIHLFCYALFVFYKEFTLYSQTFFSKACFSQKKHLSLHKELVLRN